MDNWCCFLMERKLSPWKTSVAFSEETIMDNWCCFLRGNYRYGKRVLLSQRKLSWTTGVAFSEETIAMEN